MATPIPGRTMSQHVTVLTGPTREQRGTLYFAVAEDGSPRFGATLCSKHDVFTRKKGTNIAAKRAEHCNDRHYKVHPSMHADAVAFLHRCEQFFGFEKLVSRFGAMFTV